MKTFSGAKGKPLDRKTALACMGLNLLATPGLGTLMAGRYIAGAAQIAIATTGFFLFVTFITALFKSLLGEAAPLPHWKWEVGVSLFAAAWIASYISSRDFVAKASAQIPPKLDGTNG